MVSLWVLLFAWGCEFGCASLWIWLWLLVVGSMVLLRLIVVVMRRFLRMDCCWSLLRICFSRACCCWLLVGDNWIMFFDWSLCGFNVVAGH